jgi:chemotaxis protein methyltransferase CheR
MRLTPDDLRNIQQLIRELTGIELDESKTYLIECRLQNLAREMGCATWMDFHARARYGQDAKLRDRIIDAITTNETYFFRDTAPYEALRSGVFAGILKSAALNQRPKRIRVWCAGCSTGQEPYSVGIVLLESMPTTQGWTIEILASDLAERVVKQAESGVYREHEVSRGLNQELRNRYFEPRDGGWAVNARLRALIRFERRNLLEPFRGLGKFDLIMCRNVAIYFSAAARRDLFRRFAHELTDDGCTFVGAGESLADLSDCYQQESAAGYVYFRKVGKKPQVLPTPIPPAIIRPAVPAALISPTPPKR